MLISLKLIRHLAHSPTLGMFDPFDDSPGLKSEYAQYG